MSVVEIPGWLVELSVEMMVSVMAEPMLERRLVMRYAAREMGRVVCPGGRFAEGF